MQVLEEREKTHGDYAVTATVAQDIKDALRNTVGWVHLSARQKESLDLIATKLARVVSGNANEADHWKDIAGYATLVETALVGRGVPWTTSCPEEAGVRTVLAWPECPPTSQAHSRT